MQVIRNATLAGGRTRDVRVGDDGRIDAVGEGLAGEELVDAGGKLLLPGMIDVHVHFRQPGTATRRRGRRGRAARPRAASPPSSSSRTPTRRR